MPPVAMHPQAKFDPIPPDLDLHSLVQDTPNFEWATQISASEIFALGQQRFEKLVMIHVINGGKPLVIKDWNDRLPKGLFSAKWLEEVYNRKEERVWDINGKNNIPMTMGHYLRSMKQLTDQWTPRNFRDERRQRLYLKDIDCPPEWQEKLAKVLPRLIFYLNEDIEGGLSMNHHNGMTDDDNDMFIDDRPTARAGDLMSSLPPDMRAENLMCYIGHEGTYTPAHREMCASLGQNIMVEASGSENGEKPGSSIWFMTETKDREVVGEYFLSMLGHDVEIEKHFAQINAWKKAAFPVYIVEQKVGDLILVPPLAPHQVWNRGTRTMKVAWNRTVVETLEMALHEALPKARLVCRDEQYKNKAIIYYTMKKYYKELEYAQTDRQLVSFGISQDTRNPVRTSQVAADFKKLMRLYTEILVDEMFNTKEKNVEYIPFDSNITCSYCRSNIFNRFLTCKHCVRQLADGDEDTYDVCMECYAMGRSCMCVSGLGWCEQWPWGELVSNYDKWQAMVVSNDAFIDAFSSPPPLEVARLRAGKKPVAQICQEQLRRRPFRDITKPVEKPQEPEEPEVDDDGKVIKKKAKSRWAKKGDVYRCHVCCHKDHRYRLAFCTTPGCVEAYCYGVLYRGFDMMPQSVMQKEYWKCPRCMKICNCGACRRAGITNPYIPKGTLLGHDTRPIADDRSVESLINFRLHNLLWLKNSGEEGRSIASKRMQRLRQKADAAKAQDADGDLAGGFGSIQNGGSSQDHSMVDADGHGGTATGVHGADGSFGSATVGPDGQPLHEVHGDEAGVNPSLLHNGSATSCPELVEDYPDPNDSVLNSELAATTFGRAYYMDDDDSPNKILFDPYHEPAPNPMVGNLGSLDTLPEFLESYTQKPIRKPRKETDLDPDYTGPRKRNRKKPSAAEETDPNMNLDPALLNAQPANGATTSTGEAPDGSGSETRAAAPAAPTSSIEAAIATAMAGAAAQLESMAAAQAAKAATADANNTTNTNSTNKGNGGGAADKADDEPTHGYPANVPELRHARPKVSYLVDVASDNEADEETTTTSKKEKPAVVNDTNVIPSVEKEPTADEALMSPSPVPEEPAKPVSVSKTPAAVDTPSTTKEAGSTTLQTTTEPRKRGRPPRSSLPGGATPSSEPAVKKSRIAASVAFSGKKSVEGFGSAWKPVNATVHPGPGPGPGPGRPPKRPSFVDSDDDDDDNDDVDNNDDNNDDNDDDNDGSFRPGSNSVPEKRSPGRPPKSVGRPSLSSSAAAVDRPRPSTPSLLPPPSTKFMSMAERMALKGKKFKMAGKEKNKESNDKEKEKENSATPSSVTSPSTATAPKPSSSVVVEAADKPKPKDTPPSSTKKPSLTPKPAPAITRRRANSSDGSSDDEFPTSSLPTRGTPGSGRGRGRPTRGRPIGSGSGRDRGPTVVRLVSSDSEGDSGSGSDNGGNKKRPARRRSDSNSDDDSDGSASASGSDSGGSTVRRPFFARRGGMRGRGGRGRGRPRGRPAGVTR
ncbi:hypothetical protein Sste5346_003757 [Sporothrix stenoceras]|uniref:JmjC domain-containing protein n=1 Tax=Sporothrix stenoceras TaxID=5173 RepID=A0ABR3ZC51_9PEZI